MAWIELHDTVREHPKTYALAQALNLRPYAAVGLMACLWTWALTNAVDGDLSRFPDAAIARACGWTRRPGALVDALMSCGLLDPDRTLHDWQDYAGRLIQRREANAERVRRSRQRHAGVTRTQCLGNGATVPYPTEPDLTQPDPTEPNLTGMTETPAASPRASARQRVMRSLQVNEMRALAGEDAALRFDALLAAGAWSEDQINTALEYARRKQARGEINNLLGYVHELLRDWDERGLCEREEIQDALAGLSPL